MKMFLMDHQDLMEKNQDLMERKIVHLQSSLQLVMDQNKSLMDQSKLVQAQLKNLVQNFEQKKDPVNRNGDEIDADDTFCKSKLGKT